MTPTEIINAIHVLNAIAKDANDEKLKKAIIKKILELIQLL